MEQKSRESICILPNRLMLGGIERVLLDALKVLHTKYDIEILCFVDEQCHPILDQIPEGVKVTCRKLPNRKLAARMPFLRKRYYQKALAGKHYDHLIVLRPSVINAVYAKMARHTVFWCHNDDYLDYGGKKLPLRRRIGKMLLRNAYKKYDMVWTVSETIKTEMRHCFSLDNVHALPNPLDCAGIIRKAETDCDLTFDSSKTNILLIGRMSPEKGFRRALRFLCGDLLKKYPNARLHLIGPDTNDLRLQEQIDKMGMAESVRLLGPQGNPYPYLKQAQLLICPSVRESFGLVMLEAMLLGVPVITTDTVGGRYVTQNGRYGCCVANDDNALADAVRRYLEHPDCGYSLADAKKWACEHDITLFGERLLGSLEQ